MKNQERLYLAVGGADPELVARSEKRRRSLPGSGADTGACPSFADRTARHRRARPAGDSGPGCYRTTRLSKAGP